jgi:uncharacterized protein (DUF1501 family)
MTSTTRRDFLKTSLGASLLGTILPAAPGFLARAPAAPLRRKADGTILVALQLAGGNDGLNAIVPYANDDYGRNRRTLRLTAREVLKIDADLGFHPGMPAMKRLFDDGLLTVVQGVGYPQPNQSHETSMRIWQTGHPEDPMFQTGWLGRAADALVGLAPADMPAVFVGQIARPFVLNARTAVVPSVGKIEDCFLRSASGHMEPAGRPNALLEFVRQTAAAADVLNRKLETAAKRPTNVDYPPLPLAQSLRTVAQLIRAEAGIRLFVVELGGQEPGGFDTHANQRDNHASLLRQLSQCVAAWADDLCGDRLLDRVVLMTYSEFGRTLAENGRRGTDHGSAAPVFLVGGRLRGGLVGPHPDLADIENGGGGKHHTDFRRLYAVLLESWLGLDARAILSGDFKPLDLLRDA